MSYKNVTSRRAVQLAAIECDRLGQKAFLEHYGFEYTPNYLLRLNGRTYNPAAILGVAYGYQFPDEGQLKVSDFKVESATLGRHLVRLGFEVDGLQADRTDWSVGEVEAIIEAYFNMLDRQLQGEKVSKHEVNKTLLQRINRSKSSIGQKHKNISAALENMGLPYLDGYRPRYNSQMLLRGMVEDYLATRPDIIGTIGIIPQTSLLAFEEPPNTEMGVGFGHRLPRRAVQIDFARRDSDDRRLGRAGEEWVVALERERLRAADQEKLAVQVRWISSILGDGLGYDIESFDLNGEKIFIEVKTTNGNANMPFFVSSNELERSRELGQAFALYRVHSFATAPRLFVLRGPIDTNCELLPTTWRAQPKLPTSDKMLDQSARNTAQIALS